MMTGSEHGQGRKDFPAFIGIVEAPDETSALKAAIEEFGIINPQHRNRLFVRRVPGDDD